MVGLDSGQEYLVFSSAEAEWSLQGEVRERVHRGEQVA